MKQQLVKILFAALAMGCTMGAYGAVPGDAELLPGMDKNIEEVSWSGDGVADVLGELAEEAGINMVVSKGVTGNVAMKLRNVTMKEAFDIIVFQNNLAYVAKGPILYVMSGAEYETQYGEAFGDVREVKVLRLKYAIPERAFGMVQNLKSSIGQVTVDEESGTVLIQDTPNKIAEMEKTLQVLEGKGEIEVINLNYARAKDVAERLRPELDEKKVGSIIADEKSNQVIVRALTERMKDIKTLIAALDRKTKQVLIDTKILQVQLKDNFDAEIRWEGIFSALTSNGMEFLSSGPLFPMSRTGQSNITEFAQLDPAVTPKYMPPVLPGSEMFFGVYNQDTSEDKVAGMLKLLRVLGDVKILSNPKLSVVNNMEAKIHVGRKQPYVLTTTSQAQTTTTVAEDINFVDIGIILRVTPTINDEGYITMQIKPEVNSAADQPLTTPGGNQIPIVDTSLAETTVMAKDGSTILIGGLRKEEETKLVKRVPFFSSLPIIGNLSRSRSSAKLRSEVLVMITPHIVSGDVLATADDISVGEGIKSYLEYTASEEGAGDVASPVIRRHSPRERRGRD